MRPRESSLEVTHRVPEEGEPVALGGKTLARPARVLCWQDVPFGVRHQSHDAPRQVAEAGDVALRAVGVDRERAWIPGFVAVTQDRLPRLDQPLELPVHATNETPFAVGDRQV